MHVLEFHKAITYTHNRQPRRSSDRRALRSSQAMIVRAHTPCALKDNSLFPLTRLFYWQDSEETSSQQRRCRARCPWSPAAAFCAETHETRYRRTCLSASHIIRLRLQSLPVSPWASARSPRFHLALVQGTCEAPSARAQKVDGRYSQCASGSTVVHHSIEPDSETDKDIALKNLNEYMHIW